MMKLKIKNKKGFTLIELLITILIIGILGAIAASVYGKQYIIKARLTEVINSLEIVASAVAAYYQENETFPSNVPVTMIKDSLGVSLPDWTTTARFSDLNVQNGVITATVARVDESVNGRTIVLRPSTTSDGAITWIWDNALSTISHIYIPKR